MNFTMAAVTAVKFSVHSPSVLFLKQAVYRYPTVKSSILGVTKRNYASI